MQRQPTAENYDRIYQIARKRALEIIRFQIQEYKITKEELFDYENN